MVWNKVKPKKPTPIQMPVLYKERTLGETKSHQKRNQIIFLECQSTYWRFYFTCNMCKLEDQMYVFKRYLKFLISLN